MSAAEVWRRCVAWVRRRALERELSNELVVLLEHDGRVGSKYDRPTAARGPIPDERSSGVEHAVSTLSGGGDRAALEPAIAQAVEPDRNLRKALSNVHDVWPFLE